MAKAKRDPNTIVIPFLKDKDGKWLLVDRARWRTDFRPKRPGLFHEPSGFIEPYTDNPNYSPNYVNHKSTLSLFGTGKRWSYMRDMVGSWSKKLWYKPCFHETLYQQLRSPTSDWVLTNNGNFRVHISPTGLGAIMRDCLRENVPFPDDAFLDDLAARSTKRFLDYVQPVTSLLNILLELKELCEGNIKILQRLQNMFAKLKKSFLEHLKRTDNYWLAWWFGIKPSLNDIKESVNLLQTARKRIEHLKKVNHTATTERYRRPDCWKPPEGYSFDVPTPLTCVAATTYSTGFDPTHSAPESVTLSYEMSYSLRFVCEDYSLDYCACGLIRYDLPNQLVDGSFECMGQMIMALQGMYTPGEIVWEAVPFSWAIDYFLSERQKLDRWLQLRTILPRNLEPGTPGFDEGWAQYPLPQVLATGHSFKCLSTWRVYLVDNYGAVEDLGIVRYRLYTRSYGLPERETSPFRNPFGDFQKDSYGIACALQRTWRNR